MISLLVIGACSVVPKKLDSLGQDDGHQFVREVLARKTDSLFDQLNTSDLAVEQALHFFHQTTYVRGDTLRLRFGGMEQYDGLYKITAEGNIDLPFARSFPATEVSREDLITNIEAELVRLKWFYNDSVNVDLSLVSLAAINVSVKGAVFNAGIISINGQPITKQNDSIEQQAGAFTSRRDLASALSAAGGLRPDADISSVIIRRGQNVVSVSLTSMINGNGFVDNLTLIDGDQVFVRSTGLINPLLIKPSQVTPPGMRVFMSNLTAPALSNAQSAVGADSTRVPYGSSLLDSAISANCVGGTHQANASRSVVLITRNLGSKQQLVVRRSINQLLANSSNHKVNPFIMPNDGIACYDSRFTNFRDVARGIGEVISPILLGRLL
jgi:protein involved in polysaccharide export with SLBB domain